MDAIAVDHLIKRYGPFTAVDDVSFAVEEGEFFAFLGPNGAGKTTTIQSIVGLSLFQSGSIRIFGHDVVKDFREARQAIGFAPQEYNFDRYLTIREILTYHGGYFGMPSAQARSRADELLEQFDLTSKAKLDYLKLSGGMKRRLSIARALMHNPKILILDEPSAGIDLELRLDLWERLRSLNRAGMTIFLTTHYLEEAEQLCRRIGIINHGKLIALDRKDDLLSQLGKRSLRLVLDHPLQSLPDSLTTHRVDWQAGDRELEIHDVQADQIAPLLSELKLPVVDLSYQRENLQDLFLQLTSRKNGKH